ncbi:symmetrical bis(5'-nucleosyl)-tetraphosphatase [Chromatocurvus halotolerans]|uniref:Bis(5'-nucleosyl)-tetraphosphatase, symmetrical n=1 Tax=Chromatocurvus halotolerans TaxID=1132028 RepID=A0A4R2KMG2_9GAMM|nr:symmetrical bis(5'-nucleosyl)-tetraphosphatase [Chromatocurvus halotolerans]TCO73737.1 bis(5'nucleosyl)-tetraphosphatase ApaH [Chromatocurvus halotolerans]
MSTWAVGDLQGCLQPLQCLLERVNFNTDRDMLWSVGDIVNRGPSCLDTLRWFHERRDNIRMVLGNHDLHLLAAAAGHKTLSRSDTLAPILAAPDRDTLLDWLRQRPLLWQEHGVTMVHAGIPPQWSVAESAARAREVEAVLRGDCYEDFFAAMYGNSPDIWNDALTGNDRLRVITNYFTRMRYCTAEGRLDLVSKGPLHDPGEPAASDPGLRAWFQHPQRRAAKDRIVFGHWASIQGQTGDPNAIALDTGCVWGGHMTLYCLETGERESCRCRDGVAG